MVVAVAKAIEEGARAIICASTGNTSASAAAYGAAAGLEVVVVLPAGQIAPASCSRRSSPGARVVAVDGGFDEALRVVRELTEGAPPGPPGHARQLGQPVSAAGPEDGRVRGLRGPRRCARLPRHPGRQRGQHHAPTGWASPTTATAGLVETRPGDARLPGGGRGAARARPPRRRPEDGRHGDPHRRPGQRRTWRCGRATSRAADRGGDRRGDPRRLPRPRPLRGHLLRAGQRRVGGRACASWPREGRIDPGATIVCVLTGHGLKDPDTAAR